MEKYRLPNLETNRLIIRPMQSTDVQDLYEISSNPKVTKFLTYETHGSIEETKSTVDNIFLNRPEKGLYEAYVIVYKENNKMIGCCDYINRNHVITIGYQLNEDYWNQGIMSEALDAVIKQAFKLEGIERIFIEHDPNNIGSQKVIEKAGFKKIGLARKAIPLANGSFGDSIQYDLIKEDLLP